MKCLIALAFVASLVCPSIGGTAESVKYPAPRFPSYVRPPKSIEDVMPFARAAVRQTGGRTPLGLVEQGQTVVIFTEPAADEMVMQAIKRAYEERGVKIQIVPEYQLLGVSREEALKAVRRIAGSLQNRATWKFAHGSYNVSAMPRFRKNGSRNGDRIYISWSSSAKMMLLRISSI